MEFQERAKELANAWVQFLSGANRWTKRLPHGVLVLQLEQLFSVSAMGSAASTGQDVGRQVQRPQECFCFKNQKVKFSSPVLTCTLPLILLAIQYPHSSALAHKAVAAVFGPRAVARLFGGRYGDPRGRPHLW